MAFDLYSQGKNGARQTPGYSVQHRAVPEIVDSIFRALISDLMNMNLTVYGSSI